MKKVQYHKISITSIVSLMVVIQAVVAQPQQPVPSPRIATQPVRQVKLTRWSLQSSAVVKDDGAVLSDPAYQAPDYWYPVSVPSTVLTGLVANKVYPDPYTGMNNMLIPDASDSFNREY